MGEIKIITEIIESKTNQLKGNIEQYNLMIAHPELTNQTSDYCSKTQETLGELYFNSASEMGKNLTSFANNINAMLTSFEQTDENIKIKVGG